MTKQIIENISTENLIKFFRKKISSFKKRQENFDYLIPDNLQEQFSNLQKLGEAELKGTDELLILSCSFDGELSSRSSKLKQYEIAKKVLRTEVKDAAIFIFYDDLGKFRFSFIQTNYTSNKEKYSTWKRYTYFVDPAKTNNTFKKRIDACTFTSLEEILEAFSVEPLNEEFYNKIVYAFYRLVGGEVGRGRRKEKLKAELQLPTGVADQETFRRFSVRLIGRIIFCWFLKHKTSNANISLIQDDWLSSKEVGDNYYHGVLEQLFFEVLNRKQEDRKPDLAKDHRMIPFLSGSIFEPQKGVDFYDDASAQKINYSLVIPDKWFKDLFEILEQYNFTIDENSVNDAEVSVDPEMLGRIFENLLAEIDPTSDKTSVRKATGSYYTPREIVEYMAEEALVKCLKNKTGFKEKDLHLLFKDTETDSIAFLDEQKRTLIDAFDSIKILDPAAGSGAFPMGVLHKMITGLRKIDPDAELWKEKQLSHITNALVRKDLKEKLETSSPEYRRKLGVIQNSIFGADVQPIAAEISKLRCFLTLIVDEEVNDNLPNRGIESLPNLEFKFVTANSLISLDILGMETELVDKKIPELKVIRKDYLQAHGKEKAALRQKFMDLQKEIFNDQLRFDASPDSRPLRLANWDPFLNQENDWFDPEWMFGVQQFDIIIGNPPYGGTKISEKLKKKLGLKSKDPYGAFIAKYLRKAEKKGSYSINPQEYRTQLANNGILAFIVSDTFMTIKTHKPLRDFILENCIHSMIRVHPDTFKATVNTAIIICQRLEKEKPINEPLLMADFTNISIHARHNRFIGLLNKVLEYEQPDFSGDNFQDEGVLYMKGTDWTSESSEEYAVYTYLQSLIKTNSNHPFFVASPKLFQLMNDTKAIKTEVTFNNEKVKAREIRINDEKIKIVKLGDIAEVKQGLATGDNDAYLFQKPEARGSYRSILDHKQFLLTERDLEKIRHDEDLRLKIIDKGISKDSFSSERYFGGRYIVPYDKGGESNAQGGWMPNYFVPTNYFIDWSEWAVNRLKSYTIAQRIKDKNESKKIKVHYNSTCCAVIRSPSKFFKESISFSRTGIYSPTFRLGSSAKFDTEGSMIFQDIYSPLILCGVMSSKFAKFQLKCFIGHTIHTQVDELKEFALTSNISKFKKIGNEVDEIVQIQKKEELFDYNSYNQLHIDLLVYNSYSFLKDDIQEVENWYARRYPKLVKAQKKNLEALGKSTNYLELYQDLAEKYGGL